jgi:hypothetical protein
LTCRSRSAAAARGSKPCAARHLRDQRIEQDALAAGTQFKRQKRRTTGQRQPVFGLADAGVVQPLHREVLRRAANGDRLTAAANRRQQAMRFTGNQDEQGRCDRFFK